MRYALVKEASICNGYGRMDRRILQGDSCVGARGEAYPGGLASNEDGSRTPGHKLLQSAV